MFFPSVRLDESTIIDLLAGLRATVASITSVSSSSRPTSMPWSLRRVRRGRRTRHSFRGPRRWHLAVHPRPGRHRGRAALLLSGRIGAPYEVPPGGAGHLASVAGDADFLRSSTMVALALTLGWAIASCGGSDDAGGAGARPTPAPSRSRQRSLSFNGDPGTIVSGDTIEFDVSNTGVLEHSMEVLSSEGSSLGKTGR